MTQVLRIQKQKSHQKFVKYNLRHDDLLKHRPGMMLANFWRNPSILFDRLRSCFELRIERMIWWIFSQTKSDCERWRVRFVLLFFYHHGLMMVLSGEFSRRTNTASNLADKRVSIRKLALFILKMKFHLHLIHLVCHKQSAFNFEPYRQLRTLPSSQNFKSLQSRLNSKFFQPTFNSKSSQTITSPHQL